jgi:hypothetical protein
LVLIADALLVSKATSVFPGDQTVVIDSPSKKEQFIFQLLTVIALVFTALSTVISGYGDILWFYT